jgi:hypothetical protein
MNKFFLTAVFLQIISHSFSQQIPLLDTSTRWILVHNKIDKNEIFLTSYKKSKVNLNTLVMTFAENGKIIYDYETNSKYAENLDIKYLDINTKESFWSYDTLTNSLILSIQGGYLTLDDFRFKREYKIDEVNDGYILMKRKELISNDLRKKTLTRKEDRKNASSRVSPVSVSTKNVRENEIIYGNSSKAKNVLGGTSVVSNSAEPKLNFSINKSTAFHDNDEYIPAETLFDSQTDPSEKINYLELKKTLFDQSKRWILIRNKIEKGDIYLTPYHESKLTINNLVLNLSENGTIQYDYESDPKIKFCAGVDFLDIDTEQTSWVFDFNYNIFTLTLKGGYASLDDFKFKRDYTVEAFDDGFALRKVKEHYFNDFRKAKKTSSSYSKKRK